VNEKLIISSIIEALNKNGAFDQDDLFKNMQRLYGDLDRRTFNELIMELEIQGLVKVYNMTKDKRRIELGRL